MPAIAYIGLGSNLENPRQQVESAVEAIVTLPHTKLAGHSRWYRSKAIGPGTQPDYVNGAIAIHTSLAPLLLLDHLQAIEQLHGRQREIRWGARTLDLDLLLYDNMTLDTERLQLPHPRMGERSFVLYPLADITPELVLPDGTRLQALVASCQDNDLHVLTND